MGSASRRARAKERNGRSPHSNVPILVSDGEHEHIDSDNDVVGAKRKRTNAITFDDSDNDANDTHETIDQDDSTATLSARRTRQPTQQQPLMSVANLQAQEREIAKLKARMVSKEKETQSSLRKGVRPSPVGPSSPLPSSSSKRSRARSMRPGAMRRSPRSPAAADPRLANVAPVVRKAAPVVALDDEDDNEENAATAAAAATTPRLFTSPADAIHAAVLHSTAWRNVKLDQAPCNVLPNDPTIAEPFAVAYDAPLRSFDPLNDVLAAKTAVVAAFPHAAPLSLLTSSPKESALRAALEERVTALVEEATPLIKLAHLYRAKRIIAKTRKQVRSYLHALPQHRERVEEIARSFRPLQISRLEKVATRMILNTDTSVSSDPIVYTIGRGESALSERTIVHDHAVPLRVVAGLSRSTTCVETKGLVKISDDPIIRFVPLFSADELSKSHATSSLFDDQFDGFGGGGSGFLAASDDERKELLLRFIVHEVQGDPAVFGVLEDLRLFKQPHIDYMEVFNRDVRSTWQQQRFELLKQLPSDDRAAAIERLSAVYVQRAAGATLRDRLALPPVHFAILQLDEDDTNKRLAVHAAPHDRYCDVAMRFQRFFCRRCVAYNCLNHGLQQPLPAMRTDPKYPPVKAAQRLERTAAAAAAAATRSTNGEKMITASARDDDDVVKDAKRSIADCTNVDTVDTTVNNDEDDEENDANEPVRRSVRSRTAASTKASTILVTQRSKDAKRKTPAMRLLRGVQSDVSEYLGLDAVYRAITLERRTQLLTPDARCGPSCVHAISADATAFRKWTRAELLLVDKTLASVGRLPCAVAAIVRTTTCAAVAAYVHQRTTSTSKSLVGMARDSVRTIGARGNSHEHLRRTRVQRMKDRGANHAFVPCAHDASVSCNTSDCSCMQRDHYCEAACSCSRDCPNRFPGCLCSAVGQPCRSAACPCFVAGRECDPDVCVTCGACELPVEVGASSIGVDAVAATATGCGNVNLLRGCMRRVGVAASETHGWGAFAREPIARGDFIYEYTGELLSQDEAERRGNVYDKSTVSFLFDLNEDAVVDATRKGNKSKFANHTAASPKCIARILRVRGDHRIGIFANVDIAENEELFFDYGYSGVVPDWTRGHVDGSGGSGHAIPANVPAWHLDVDGNGVKVEGEEETTEEVNGKERNVKVEVKREEVEAEPEENEE